MAAAAAGEDSSAAVPPMLDFAWKTGKYGLPYRGGWMEQPLKLLNQMNELIYEKSVKKSRLQFKEWLTQKGYDIEKLSEEEISDMIKNLQVNSSF